VSEPAEQGGRRTVIVLASIAGVLLVAVVIALTMLLQRTSAPSTGTPPPAPPAPATSSESPAPEEQPAAGVRLDADGLTITDADGAEILVHAWGDEAAPAVAALTDAFGSAPTEGFEEGDADHYAYRLYEWEGFVFADVALGEGNRPREEVDAPTYGSFSAGTVGDVEIEAEIDLAIGQRVADVRAAGPDRESADAPPVFFFGEDRSTFYADGVRQYGVRVETDGSAVTSITYRYLPAGS
jgi:hypothetical protein